MKRSVLAVWAQEGMKMADLLEFLDSVSIDVVKRKYYNANKVNAVFEELREHAAALMQENEQLRHALNSQSEEQQKSLKALESLQAAYREALSSAHARADEMLDSAAAESSAMRKKAEQRAENAARQVEECLNAVRVRAEQNVEFINTQLQQFLTKLYDEDSEHTAVPVAGQEGKDVSGDPLADLQSKISAISSEISALEQGTE